MTISTNSSSLSVSSLNKLSVNMMKIVRCSRDVEHKTRLMQLLLLYVLNFEVRSRHLDTTFNILLSLFLQSFNISLSTDNLLARENHQFRVLEHEVSIVV